MSGFNLFSFLQTGAAIAPGSREDGYLFDYRDYGIPRTDNPLAVEQQIWGGMTPPIVPPQSVTPPATSGNAFGRTLGKGVQDLLEIGPVLLNPGAATLKLGPKATGEALNTTAGLFVNGALIILGVILMIGAFMLWGRAQSGPIVNSVRKWANE